MSIHITHHTYNIASTKKPFENIFYLRNSPVQTLQKNTYEGWFAGQFPSPLQDGESYTDTNGRATCLTTCMYENAVISGFPF